jgi:hypothetical protein
VPTHYEGNSATGKQLKYYYIVLQKRLKKDQDQELPATDVENEIFYEIKASFLK